jgi:dihydrolipoamide dehydrogenase
MVVLGAGPGGYSAAFRAADLGLKTVIVERYATLGGVCLNVGCIPSKALLHVAAVMDEAEHAPPASASPSPVDIDAARPQGQGRRQADRRPGRHGQGPQGGHVRGYGTSSTRTTSKSKKPPAPARTRPAPRRSSSSSSASSPPVRRVHLPFIPRDPRIVDSTGALELRFVPGKMLVIGGGIIGLEMATVYSTLGARVDVVEMMDGLMQGPTATPSRCGRSRTPAASTRSC